MSIESKVLTCVEHEFVDSIMVHLPCGIGSMNQVAISRSVSHIFLSVIPHITIPVLHRLREKE
jgi:hypothetical protein